MIQLIDVLQKSHQSSHLSAVQSLHSYLEQNAKGHVPSLHGISLPELKELVQKLCDSGALIPHFKRISHQQAAVEYDTTLQLSAAGYNFVETLNTIRNGHFAVESAEITTN